MFQFSKALLLFSAHWRTGPGISMAPTGIWFQPRPWISVLDATLHREVRGKGPFHAPWAEERKQPATCFNQSMQDIILPQESPRITNHCKQCGWLRLNCGDGPLESWYHVFKERGGGVQKVPQSWSIARVRTVITVFLYIMPLTSAEIHIHIHGGLFDSRLQV